MPSSSKSAAKIGDPAFDPYNVLGIPQGASNADITKAYRRLALQLHPDKQQNLSEREQEKIAHEFHTLQEARAFLLDTEHAEARRAYDTKRASQRLRQEQDAQREKHMSERRKRMRDELRQKEQATTAASPQDGTKENLLDKLRREGANLRQQHSDRAAKDESRKMARNEKKAQALVEERQVRIKWSRSKIQISPSEHSLAQLLSQKFGPVTSVEMVGSKGNSALITFVNASSCRPCVDAYATSEEMRASFVGKRKQEQYEEEMETRQEHIAKTQRIPRSRSSGKDEEGLEERKHRQAMERERMIRQMEMEDAGHTVTETKKKEAAMMKKRGRPFPLEFAESDRKLTPLQTLESFEKVVFGNVLSPESMQRMQVTP